jgi:Holliday junction resolvase-like predicted endonuclease
MNPRQQGDLGEQSAVEWLWSQGHPVFVPFGHSPDIDLIALIDGRAVRVQVKTSRRHIPTDRWSVMICTRGGNQSWNGLSKHFSSDRCDHLFVLVGDGRRWFIPSSAVQGRTSIALGGPTYAAYEVEPGRPFATTPLHSAPPLAG